VRKLTIGAAAS